VVAGRGACVAGRSEAADGFLWAVDLLCEVPLLRVLLADELGLIVLPGKALAATAVSRPVRAALAASSQRLYRRSWRTPASLARVE
jgi:hypothetical protein